MFAQCSLRVSEYKAICTAKLTVTFRYLLQAIVLEYWKFEKCSMKYRGSSEDPSQTGARTASTAIELHEASSI